MMVEALPCPGPDVPDPLDAELMADACRIAFEHGATSAQDLLSRLARRVRAHRGRGLPAPVLIAGGPKLPDELAVLEMVADSDRRRRAGVVFGRNIWQSPDPAGMVRALRAIIHDGATGRDAAALARG